MLLLAPGTLNLERLFLSVGCPRCLNRRKPRGR